MKTRVISAIVAIIIGIVVIMQYYTVLFDIAAFAVYAMAVGEIYRTFKDGNSKIAAVLLAAAGGLVLFNSLFAVNLLTLAVVFTVAAVCIVVFDFEKISFTSIASTVAFSAYVLFCIYSVLRLKYIMPVNAFGYDAAFLVVLCAGIAWGGDSMAYFAGYFFGKHKMAPKLSPKKTMEGAVGGIAGSVVIALLMTYVYGLTPYSVNSVVSDIGKNWIFLVVFAAIGSFVGIIGDLFASAVKRQQGIKDYGNIMPGHGGVLDRFDSFFLVATIISLMADFIVRSNGVI
ncbi:MAG: phosphatidate cytidylyltransferase [Oscillospiraceae bacterium]|nr:phosphatidate cytidylyltransferase [Oscillospiraceae bacterium]